MRPIRLIASIVLALLALASCNRDPNVAKQRYLESGNRYLEKGLYNQARIKFKNALQKDMRFGPAYYGLAMAEYKRGSLGPAVGAFQRAIELIPPDRAEHWDSVVKISEIYIMGARDSKQLMEEVQGYCKELLKRDPKSFDGHRLMGDYDFVQALNAAKTARKEDAAALLDEALQEYHAADAINPKQARIELQLARTLSGKGDFPAAEQMYREVINQDKTGQEAYSELYRLYLIQRKADPAEQLLKEGFQNNPKQVEFLRALAMHYSIEKRTPEMVAVLEQIKAHAKEFDGAYRIVGDLYLRQGDGDTAIKEYREGITHEPKKKLLYEKHIIEVLMRQGKRSEAADLNSQILKTDPNDNDARGLAATFLLDKGDIGHAITELETVVTRDPQNAVARYNLGRAYLAQGQFEQARQMFQRSIELRPDVLGPQLALAQLQVGRGEFDAALKTAGNILALDRNNLNARLLESAALMGQKKFADSRQLLDGMSKVNPNSPDIYFHLGVVNYAEKKYKEAEDNFRKSYELNPANARGLIAIVETEMVQGRVDGALAMLQREIEKTPNRLEFRVALAKAAARVGKFDMAIGEYQQVLNAMDKSSRPKAQIYYELGEVYRRKGDDQNAIASLQKAREITPENGMVLTTLGLSFDHAGRPDEAKKIYETALKLDSSNAVALNNLAFLLAEHNGDLDDALTKGTRAKQLLPDLNEVSDTLGWIYLKKNLTDNALETFKQLVAKAPNQATYRYHLGLALKQKGDKPKAIKELQEALKNNPTKDERQKIQDALSQLNGA